MRRVIQDLDISDLSVDEHSLEVRRGKTSVRLTPMEFKLFGFVYSRCRLGKSVSVMEARAEMYWDIDNDPQSGSLMAVYFNKIRKALEPVNIDIRSYSSKIIISNLKSNNNYDMTSDDLEQIFIDVKRRIVKCDGKQIPFSETEIKLIAFLLDRQKANEMVTSDDVADAIYGESGTEKMRRKTVQHIGRIRRQFADMGMNLTISSYHVRFFKFQRVSRE